MKVIVALDQSPYAKQVLDTVSHRRWHRDTAFKLLTVIEPMPFEWQQVRSATWKKMAQEQLDEIRQNVKHMMALARRELQTNFANCSVHVEIRHGNACEEIVEAAVEWCADKIVIGAHGLSQNRLFPGFVSHSVANHATCSVELIRLNQTAQGTVASTPTETLHVLAPHSLFSPCSLPGFLAAAKDILKEHVK